MNTKQVILKCITLLYREHQRPDNNDHSSNLVNDIIATIKLPEISIDNDRTHHIMSGLKELAEDMTHQPVKEAFDYDDLKSRVRVIVENESSLYEGFILNTENGTKDSAELEKLCQRYRNQIQSYMADHNIRQILNDAGKTSFKGNSQTNWRDYAIKTIAELEPYTVSTEDSFDPNIVNQVEFDNIEEIEKVFESAKKEESIEGILQTGLQGFNRMCGPERMGLRRGEMVCWGGLQHKFKSGMGLALFTQIALCNDAQDKLIDKSKMPTLLMCTAENELEQNLTWMFSYIYENENKCKAPKDLTSAEKTKYVTEKMQARGWYISIVRIDPSNFTYRNFYDMILKLEGRGCEVVACFFDYLNMISKKGCDMPSGTGSDIRDLFRRVRNFTSKKKITYMTPHQLSTEAKNLLREGRADFVKEIAEKGYWDGCKTIDNELDLEFYVHIEKVGELSFLTLQRGKHRKSTITPDKYKYCVYQFEEIGTIPMDLDGKDLSRRTISSKPQGDGGGSEWWG